MPRGALELDPAVAPAALLVVLGLVGLLMDGPPHDPQQRQDRQLQEQHEIEERPVHGAMLPGTGRAVTDVARAVHGDRRRAGAIPADAPATAERQGRARSSVTAPITSSVGWAGVLTDSSYRWTSVGSLRSPARGCCGRVHRASFPIPLSTVKGSTRPVPASTSDA